MDLPRRVLDLAALGGAETVADVGCGNGAYLAELTRRGHAGPVIGIDLSTGMLPADRGRAPAAALAAGPRRSGPRHRAEITVTGHAPAAPRRANVLRSADLWELMCRVRAYDSHIYVVGANTTGTDPVGALYFGNLVIVNPLATALAGAASYESWMSTRLDPKQAMVSLTLGSSAPQVFDNIADRDRALICRHADTYSARRARYCTRAPAARKPA